MRRPYRWVPTGPLEVVDERVHLLIRRRPVESALLVLDVTVERRDRQIAQAGHLKPLPAPVVDRRSAPSSRASRRAVVPVGPVPCRASIVATATCTNCSKPVHSARVRARGAGMESWTKAGSSWSGNWVLHIAGLGSASAAETATRDGTHRSHAGQWPGEPRPNPARCRQSCRKWTQGSLVGIKERGR